MLLCDCLDSNNVDRRSDMRKTNKQLFEVRKKRYHKPELIKYDSIHEVTKGGSNPADSESPDFWIFPGTHS